MQGDNPNAGLNPCQVEKRQLTRTQRVLLSTCYRGWAMVKQIDDSRSYDK